MPLHPTFHPNHCIILQRRAYKSSEDELIEATVMQVKWGKMVIKLTVWLTAEILLGLVGLDNLADYGEFIAGDYTVSSHYRPAQTLLHTPLPNPLFSAPGFS